MTKEEAKGFLTGISYDLGSMAMEYLSEKDGEKMREAIETLGQEPSIDILDDIKKAISAQSRMHMDGDLYIKVSECMQIIDEHKTKSEDK